MSRRDQAWAIASRALVAVAVLFGLALCTVGPGLLNRLDRLDMHAEKSVAWSGAADAAGR